MDIHAGAGDRLGETLKLTRTAAAYSIVLLGLAGSIAAVPVTIWMIAVNGLQ